ncbi:MAG: TIGR04372 family glycosyltransferase [Alphaproteobacteria bacterium]|nr:TIGR04372 family glycosyltransferase [Alphaproteobacteria bacterium]
MFPSVAKFIEDIRQNDIRIVINVMPDGVGHVLLETDNFVRMKLTGEVPADRASFLLSDDYDDRLATMQRLFGDTICNVWSLNSYAGYLARIVANVAPELAVDVGISSFKYAPTDTMAADYVEFNPKAFLFRDKSGECARIGHDRYYQRRALTDGIFPFLDKVACSDSLEAFIGARGGKVAVIQIKTEISSGAGKLVDPASYEPALSLLKDEGHTLVLGGREAMPDSWQRFGVVDYANSPVANFENDFRLFRRADFGLVGASGISQFLELFDKPYVYLNTVLTAFPPFSRKAINVPALLRKVDDGRILSFAEQQAKPVWVPVSSIGTEPVNATAEQVLAAVREALDRAAHPDLPPTPRQARYRNLGPEGSFRYAKSFASDTFLKDWEHLLPPS